MPTPEFVLALRSRIGHDPLWLAGVCAVVLRPWDEPTQVLLVRRSDDGTWTPVKGIMEPGETVPETVVRECLEETGVHVEVDRLVSVGVEGPVRYHNGDVCTYLALTVRARWLAGDAQVGDDESCEVGWFALDDLPPGMRAADRVQIRIALDNPADVVLEGLSR